MNVFEKLHFQSSIQKDEKSADLSDTFEIQNGVLIKYKGCSAHVRIPDGINRIGKYAFTRSTFEKVKRHAIKPSMTWTLEDEYMTGGWEEYEDTIETVHGLDFIQKVTMPDSVTKVDSHAFYQCKNLRHVKLSHNLQAIGFSAFSDCENLQKIDMPQNLSEIGSSAFSNCKNLGKIHLPQGLRRIEARTFEGCTSLSHIQLPENLEYIGSYAFASCKSLKSIQMGARTEIGSQAFRDADVEIVRLPEDETHRETFEIQDGTLVKYHGHDAHVCVPDGVTEIGNAAFVKVIPGIGTRTLEGLDFIREVTLPESVTEINYDAFCQCKNLERINLPENLRLICSHAFAGCESLKRIVVPVDTIVHEDAFGDIDVEILSPQPKVKGDFDIRGDVLWRYHGHSTHVCVPDGVRVIRKEAFTTVTRTTRKRTLHGLDFIRKITLPEGVAEIEKHAFYGCVNLEFIHLPSSLRLIDECAFFCCDHLERIEVPWPIKINFPIFSRHTQIVRIS